MAAPSAPDARLGTVIDDRYTLVRRVGAGGTGVVYQAEQRAVGRMVAVKMLNALAADDPEWVRRFRDEAMTCARLAHPHTIRVYDVGQTKDGALFMVMELLEGQSVRQALSHGPFAASRVLKILLQICASLAEAHGLGVVHRDIKADNIFLLQVGGASDYVKVLDFSVAKLLHEGAVKTQAGMVLGTPQYMSPEQCRGLPLDARSDLYSVGILAYEMANGRLPFTASDPREVLAMQLREHVPPFEPGVPTSLAELILCALEKDPSHRFSHAGAMMRACEEALDALEAHAPQGNPRSSAPNVVQALADRPSAPRLGPSQHTIVATPMADNHAAPLPAAVPGGQAGPAIALPPGAPTLVAAQLPAPPAASPANGARRPQTEVMLAPSGTTATAMSGGKHDGKLLVLLGISIGVIAFVAVRLFLAL